jgi:hypothetical protein
MTVSVYPSPRDGALPFAAAILGIIVCIVALPVVPLVHGPLAGWALGAGLWVINWTLAQMATKFSIGASPAAGVGVAGGSIMVRAFLVVIVLYVVAIRVSQPIGLTAAIVFLSAFSFDLMGRVMLFSIMERARELNPKPKGPSDS